MNRALETIRELLPRVSKEKRMFHVEDLKRIADDIEREVFKAELRSTTGAQR